MAHLQIVKTGDILSFNISERLLCKARAARTAVISFTATNFKARLEEGRDWLLPETRMVVTELMDPKYHKGHEVTDCTIETTDDERFPDHLRFRLPPGFEDSGLFVPLKNYILSALGIRPADVDDLSFIA